MTSMKSPVSVDELHDPYKLILISMSFMTNMNSLASVGKVHDKYDLPMYIGKFHDKYGIYV